MQTIIGLTGAAGAGKTTLANAIACKRSDWRVVGFADPLRQAANDMLAKALGEEEALSAMRHKDRTIPSLGFSPRQMMQRLGTEVGRKLNPDFWIYAWEHTVRERPLMHVVAHDVRFENEAAAIRSRGGVIVEVVYTGSDAPAPTGHESERRVIPDATIYRDEGTPVHILEAQLIRVVKALQDPWFRHDYVIRR